MLETKRYLGLELAGAKNQKTSLAAIQYYPRERKTFLLDIFDRIVSHEDQTSDEALLELISEESQEQNALMGVNVPLELPPCIGCTKKACEGSARCAGPAVKWMRDFTAKLERKSKKARKAREFTPYTQRPVELWVRYHVLPMLPESHRFEVDEALGGNRAPLTARMHFLKRHLQSLPLVEVWPKLSVSIIAGYLNIPKRTVATYRHLEEGVYSREIILNHLTKDYEIFIYDRDMRKLSQSLTAFDAFICAFTALLSDQDQCAKAPKGFPSASGWVQYPVLDESP